MTVPFLSSKHTKKSTEDNIPVNATMSMPNVFVVPPEEDQTPPWCFFDAENPALSQIIERPETPDLGILGSPSDDDASTFRRNPPGSIDPVIMPRKSLESLPNIEAFLSNEEYGNNNTEGDFEFERHMEFEDNPHSIQETKRHQSPQIHYREPADDSDVIEIVKVSRRKSSEETEQERQSLGALSEYKRSGTLKSRASKVFRSLKGSLRSSKPHAQDIFPPAPSSIPNSQNLHNHDSVEHAPQEPQETIRRPRSPGVSRKGSRILSQLFAAPSLKSRSSMSSFDDPSSPVEIDSLPSPPLSPPSDFMSNASSRRSSLYNAAAQDEARLRAASPTPKTTSFNTGNRRFSILNLQKLFSFSSPTPTPLDTPIPFDESNRATPTLGSTSNSCTSPSAASSFSTVSSPQTPTSTEAVTPDHLIGLKDATDVPIFPIFNHFDSVFDTNAGDGLSLGLGLSLDSGSSFGSQQTTPRGEFGSNGTMGSWNVKQPTKASSRVPRTQPRAFHDDPGDESLEMRLDSFHFDSISFDADQF